jgi:hypothetical protein
VVYRGDRIEQDGRGAIELKLLALFMYLHREQDTVLAISLLQSILAHDNRLRKKERLRATLAYRYVYSATTADMSNEVIQKYRIYTRGSKWRGQVTTKMIVASLTVLIVLFATMVCVLLYSRKTA